MLFRAGLAEFIAFSTPVAVTRHGQTAGYVTPTQEQPDAGIAALKKAGKTLNGAAAMPAPDPLESIVQLLELDLYQAALQARARRGIAIRDSVTACTCL